MSEDAKFESVDEMEIEEPFASQTLFIDGIEGASVTNGVAKFTLFIVTRCDDGENRRRIVARLAMPINILGNVSDYIASIRKTAIESGLMSEKPPVSQSRN